MITLLHAYYHDTVANQSTVDIQAIRRSRTGSPRQGGSQQGKPCRDCRNYRRKEGQWNHQLNRKGQAAVKDSISTSTFTTCMQMARLRSGSAVFT